MTVATLQVILGTAVMLATFIGGGVSTYVAWHHRGVDRATRDQITTDIDTMQEARHAWRYRRMLQLEAYIDSDQAWHREIVEILRQAVRQGFIAPGSTIPDPPVLPPPPEPLPGKKTL